ncbi:hypothetical protein NIES2107_28450 [Nostoc carneum NIES-2107]|nr:hypothetical protein NIES2107_28450 [Nostoc carneum NIES-2107]
MYSLALKEKIHNYQLKFLFQKLKDSPTIPSESSGFSLLEVVVVVVMIGILSAIAAPSWLSFSKRQTINKANDVIVSAIQEAQGEAKRRKVSYNVSFITDNNIPKIAVYPTKDVADGYWRVLGEGLGIQSGLIVLGTNLTDTNTTTSSSTVSYASTTAKTITFDYTGALVFDNPITTNTNSLTSVQNNKIGDKGLIIAISLAKSGNPTEPTGVKRCVIVKTLLGSIKTGKDTECN